MKKLIIALLILVIIVFGFISLSNRYKTYRVEKALSSYFGEDNYTYCNYKISNNTIVFKNFGAIGLKVGTLAVDNFTGDQIDMQLDNVTTDNFTIDSVTIISLKHKQLKEAVDLKDSTLLDSFIASIRLTNIHNDNFSGSAYIDFANIAWSGDFASEDFIVNKFTGELVDGLLDINANTNLFDLVVTVAEAKRRLEMNGNSLLLGFSGERASFNYLDKGGIQFLQQEINFDEVLTYYIYDDLYSVDNRDEVEKAIRKFFVSPKSINFSDLGLLYLNGEHVPLLFNDRITETKLYQIVQLLTGGMDKE